MRRFGVGHLVGAVLVSAVMELLTRLAHPYTDRLGRMITQRCSWAEACKHFDSQEYKEHRARVILSELGSEYVTLALAPVILLSSAHLPFAMAFGYEPSTRGGGLDVELLLWGLVLQLVAEVAVDFACWRVEERLHGYPLSKQWRKVPPRRFLLGMALGTAFGNMLFFVMFIRVPGNGRADQNDPCLIGPSMCSCECELTYEHHQKFCEALTWPLRERERFVVVGGGDNATLSAYIDAVIGNASSSAKHCVPSPPSHTAT